MSGTAQVRDRLVSERSSTYFFLSYAHFPPLAGSLQADPDQWVRKFFRDLSEAVDQCAKPPRLAPGFFDQNIPVNAGWKAALTDALSTAGAFVPLLSPSYYYRSWPGKEWSCFQVRLEAAGVVTPAQRFAPVLLAPLPSDRDWPGLQQALSLGADEPAYAENGLLAMLRLSPYRESYRRIVEKLAIRITDLAENEPLSPSDTPTFDNVENALSGIDAPILTVTVAAPAPVGPPSAGDGTGRDRSGESWRPYAAEQQMPLTDYAIQVAEQLDFAVKVTNIQAARSDRRKHPGVLLIDPGIVGYSQGLQALSDFVADMPVWVLPLLVRDETPTARGAAFADEVRSILRQWAPKTETTSRAIEGVTSLHEFLSFLPVLVTEAERQYIHRAQSPRSGKSGRFWR